ncbi:hypothetical protein GZL_00279 [Streptomyces sp. 769]|nr:hypothetical protein GZL_00279 [Streptomyces sp. 769]
MGILWGGLGTATSRRCTQCRLVEHIPRLIYARRGGINSHWRKPV